MAAPSPRSTSLRRLGRAGPTDGEMELLRAASLDPERAAAAWLRWIADHDIDDAHHRSTDLLPAASANLPADVLGSDAGRTRTLRRRVWANTQFGLQALVDAAELLEAEGIAPIVAKGASLSTTVYTEPGTRAMADVDLLIGSEHFERARDALLAAGWKRLDPVEGPFFHAVAVSDEHGRGVDVHRWVVFPRFSPVPERSWLERAEPHVIGSHPIRRLASSDELVLSVLHGLLTSSPSSSRWPLDVVRLAVVAPRLEPDFWNAVVESASELRVGRVVADGLAMCSEELAADVPDDVVERLSAPPIDRGLAQHWMLCRRGITPEWRFRRYARLARSEGRSPTVLGYVRPRAEAIHARGLGSVLDVRVARVKQIVADRTRS